MGQRFFGETHPRDGGGGLGFWVEFWRGLLVFRSQATSGGRDRAAQTINTSPIGHAFEVRRERINRDVHFGNYSGLGEDPQGRATDAFDRDYARVPFAVPGMLCL